MLGKAEEAGSRLVVGGFEGYATGGGGLRLGIGVLASKWGA